MRERSGEPVVETVLRFVIGCLTLICGVLLAQRLPNPDLFSDYIAVRRWWQRFPAQSGMAAISGCDPLVNYNAFDPNPHPPFSTFLLLPLGLFAWTDARWVWFGFSSCCVRRHRSLRRFWSVSRDAGTVPVRTDNNGFDGGENAPPLRCRPDRSGSSDKSLPWTASGILPAKAQL